MVVSAGGRGGSKVHSGTHACVMELNQRYDSPGCSCPTRHTRLAKAFSLKVGNELFSCPGHHFPALFCTDDSSSIAHPRSLPSPKLPSTMRRQTNFQPTRVASQPAGDEAAERAGMSAHYLLVAPQPAHRIASCTSIESPRDGMRRPQSDRGLALAYLQHALYGPQFTQTPSSQLPLWTDLLSEFAPHVRHACLSRFG